MIRRQNDETCELRVGLVGSVGASASPGRGRVRRVGSILLLFPLVVGLLGAPGNPPVVRGDELSDAKARQAQIKRDVEREKAQVARLTSLQAGLADVIQQTTAQVRGINTDLTSVRVKMTAMQGRIDEVKATYDGLVAQLQGLDVRLTAVQSEEALKRGQLGERKALLAERVRSAYDTDRTSLLESFLSGGTFTDLLAEMSYFIDVGEQDKALAVQIAGDQATLAVLHQNVEDAQTQTNELRQETATQKQTLDRSLAALKATRAALKKLEQATAVALAQQQSAYATFARNKTAAKRALAAASAAQRKLANQIAALIERQAQAGRIPSAYNGTLSWPMAGIMTQPFGCTGFSWEPPSGSCSHFHSGIDIVAPFGTPVRSAGPGTVVYIGWNYADGADPAWIVIIAHSQALQTWYAHMQPTYPGGIAVGSHVDVGQIIGYEGNTGHSTGAHLHWAVVFNRQFVNPRLFL